MKAFAKIGATCFVLWGLLHIVGGAAILLALDNGPEQGFALYNNYEGSYTALAGAILGYFAYLLVCIAVAVTLVGGWLNWQNSWSGLVANLILVGLTDVGLLLFLVIPGFVSWGEATVGLTLFAIAALSSGIASSAIRRLPREGNGRSLAASTGRTP